METAENEAYPPITCQFVRFVNGAPVVLKSGKYSIQTVTWEWAICDRCGDGKYVDTNDLKAKWSCPRCQRTSTIKSTKKPTCKGRTSKGQKITHEPVEMVTDDPHPGRPCGISYRCLGKHRARPVDEGTPDSP